MKHMITIESPDDYANAVRVCTLLAQLADNAAMAPAAPAPAPAAPAPAPAAPAPAPAAPAPAHEVLRQQLTDIVRALGPRGSEIGAMIQEQGATNVAGLTAEQLQAVVTRAQALLK